MKIIQLEKNMEVVINGMDEDNLYFLRFDKFTSNPNRDVRRFHTVPVIYSSIQKIRELIDDPRYILVKIIEDD